MRLGSRKSQRSEDYDLFRGKAYTLNPSFKERSQSNTMFTKHANFSKRYKGNFTKPFHSLLSVRIATSHNSQQYSVGQKKTF